MKQGDIDAIALAACKRLGNCQLLAAIIEGDSVHVVFKYGYKIYTAKNIYVSDISDIVGTTDRVRDEMWSEIHSK